VFVDLQQVPERKVPQLPRQQEVRRKAERRVRVERESAPRGSDTVDRGLRPSPPAVRPRPAETQPAGRSALQKPAPPQEKRVVDGSPAAGLLKPSAQGGGAQAKPQLFPGAGRMARLEESYRRRFENDIAEGDTKFLNTDDIQFGSFLRRFENSVYGVWRYPGEASRNGIEGVTPVKITFNRRGEILHVQLLESSGSKILDDEVFRTLKLLGPVGGFPRGYDKEEFNLIAFFQYGMSRRSLK
jgi:protein TonB